MDDRAIDIARRVLQRPASERDAFLEGACGDDPPLRKRVDDTIHQMQAAQTSAPSGAARSTGNDMPTAAFAPSIHVPPNRSTTSSGSGEDFVEGAGSVIGHYKILQLIGEGGFGNVYMAQQSEPVKRRVALKIVKPGMDTKQVIGRFESERQALAMMDHPNIARVYDAGTTSTGRPYFVMELVKGVPITEYCDSAQLSTRERLELFVSVCQAVQHAHLKGIVHRDIKPSNVLVTLHDEKPVVKVIDFGIAKAMNQDLTEKTVFTEFRQFIGTPEYMSPEQAAMSGLDVDSRTDIYSLGVLLYELMSGSTPFSSEELRSAGMAEIARKIKEDEPPRPSTRVSRSTKSGTGGGSGGAKQPSTTGGPRSTTAEQIAKHRRTDIGTLRRQLAGDLDWIVMKAMEKDRSRRYETASAAAEDIRRFLANEPILARPPSTAYRLRKFARRNRVGLAAGAGVFAAILLTLVALGYGLSQARDERDRTAQRETETRAKMLLSSMNAIRQYTADNVRPALAVAGSGKQDATTPDYNAHFVREMVPGFSARQVFANFRDAKRPDGTPGPYATFVYKEAAPNPTNRENLADDFEKSLVERFRADPKLTEVSDTLDRSGTRSYFIARPMIIKDAKCIDCHRTVETAPPGQVQMYGKDGWSGGYGWKLGDVVAAQVVYVPVSQGFTSDSKLLQNVLMAAAGLLLVGGILSVILLRRA